MLSGSVFGPEKGFPMKLFEKTPPPQNEYLRKYTQMASRFQNIGIAVVLSSIALHYFGGNTMMTISLVIFCVGAIALVFGGSSLRPHNLIKSFAQQCTNDPGDIIAEGLLEAMQRYRKTALTKGSIQIIQVAIETYAQLPETDPQLIAQLREALQKNITKKVF